MEHVLHKIISYPELLLYNKLSQKQNYKEQIFKFKMEQILHKIFSDPEINFLRNKHCGRLRVLVI
jgi:hypothetical protein